MLAADRAIANQPHPDRRGCGPARCEKEQPRDELQKCRVLIGRRLVAESHVDKPTVSVGALIRDHLLRELPARAQQDVRIEGRALG